MTSPNMSTSMSVTTPSHPALVTALVLYALPLSLGTAGNAGILHVIASHKTLRTGVNAYIANMAVLDFLACSLLVPLRVLFYMAHSTLAGEGGEAVCRAEVFLHSVADAGRMLMLGAVSFERYQAVASPFSRDRAKGTRRTAILLILLWGLVLVYGAVLSVFFHDTVMYEFCMEHVTATSTEVPSSSTHFPSSTSVFVSASSSTPASTSISVSTAVQTSLSAGAFTSASSALASNSTFTSAFTLASTPASTAVPVALSPSASPSVSVQGRTWDWGLWGGIEMNFLLPLSAVTVAVVVVSYTLMFRLLHTQSVRMQRHTAHTSKVAPAPNPSISHAPISSVAPVPSVPPAPIIPPALDSRVPSPPNPGISPALESRVPSPPNPGIPPALDSRVPSPPNPGIPPATSYLPDPSVLPKQNVPYAPALSDPPSTVPVPALSPCISPAPVSDPAGSVPPTPCVPSAPRVPPAPLPTTPPTSSISPPNPSVPSCPGPSTPPCPNPAVDISPIPRASLSQPPGVTVVHVKPQSLLSEEPLAVGREERVSGECLDTEGEGMSQLNGKLGQDCVEGSPGECTCISGDFTSSRAEDTVGSPVAQTSIAQGLKAVLGEGTGLDPTKGLYSASANGGDSATIKRPSPTSNTASVKRPVSSSTKGSMPALIKGPNTAPTKGLKFSRTKGPISFPITGPTSSPMQGPNRSPSKGSHTSFTKGHDYSPTQEDTLSLTKESGPILTVGPHSSPANGRSSSLTKGKVYCPDTTSDSGMADGLTSSPTTGSTASRSERSDSSYVKEPNVPQQKELHSIRKETNDPPTVGHNSPTKGTNPSPTKEAHPIRKGHDSSTTKGPNPSPTKEAHSTTKNQNSSITRGPNPSPTKEAHSTTKEQNSSITKGPNPSPTKESHSTTKEQNSSITKGPNPAPNPTGGDNNPGPSNAVVRVVEMDGSAHVQHVNAGHNIQGDVCLFNPKNKVHGRRRVEIRVAKRLVAIFLTFLLLWLPYPLAVVSLRVLYVQEWVEAGGGGEGRQLVVDVVAVVAALGTVTAAVNPLLYGLTNVHIRSAARRSLKALCACPCGSDR